MTDTNNNDPFATTNSNQINYLEVVTQKFNKDGSLDVEGLARGKVEADNFIEQLKKELNEARQQASQGMSMKELLEAIKTQQSNPPENGTEPAAPSSTPNSSVSTEDLAKLVKDTLSATEAERKELQNRQTVVQKLNEVWGNSSATELAKKANELGISVKRLEEIGKESPTALFNLLGVNNIGVPGTASNVPRGTVALPNTSSGERTQSYYAKLYRENPKLRHNGKIAAQEHNDAIRLGQRFFDM